MASFDIARLIGLLDQGKTAEAIDIATELVREMPTHVTGHVVRARALESQGDFREALVAWRNALDLVPTSPIIKRGLSRTATKLAAPPIVKISSPEPPLPGFEPVDSMFDVEPDFEKLLSDDLTNDAPPASRLSGTQEPQLRLPADDARGRPLGGPGVDPDDLSVDAAFAAVMELETGQADDLTTDVGDELPLVAPTTPVQDDLDELIADLASARITPSDKSFPAPDLDPPVEELASETLARIYAEQKQYAEAARVYTKLAGLRPGESERLLAQASEMRALAEKA